MAIAHVCVNCGWDLSRVRPQREPHYGLNLVRCPHCQAASVRRQHPVWKGWRQFRRLDFALTMILLRVFGLAALTFFSVLGGVATIAFLSELGRLHNRAPHETGLFVVVFYIILPTVLGAFLTAAFPHLTRWKVWVGWLAWLAIILFMVALHGPLDSQFDPRNDVGDRLPSLGWILMGCMYIVLPALVACTAMLIAAIPGMFIGRLLLRLRDTLIRAKWRWRRKRLRLAGAASV